MKMQAHLRGDTTYLHKLQAACQIYDIWTQKGSDIGALAGR